MFVYAELNFSFNHCNSRWHTFPLIFVGASANKFLHTTILLIIILPIITFFLDLLLFILTSAPVAEVKFNALAVARIAR